MALTVVSSVPNAETAFPAKHGLMGADFSARMGTFPRKFEAIGSRCSGHTRVERGSHPAMHVASAA
jgi:hypothetical protein